MEYIVLIKVRNENGIAGTGSYGLMNVSPTKDDKSTRGQMRKPRHGASPLFVQTLNHLHLPKNNPTESEEANGPACGSLSVL